MLIRNPKSLSVSKNRRDEIDVKWVPTLRNIKISEIVYSAWVHALKGTVSLHYEVIPY